MALRVGLLNMMPDGAFKVSERQFASLLAGGASRACDLVRFTFDVFARSAELQAYVEANYRGPAAMKPAELDVLVITGANVSDPDLATQVFWPPLVALLDWAEVNDVPILCSCLATHALLEHRHGQRRRPVAPKVWGVYTHRQLVPGHPLLAGVATAVPVPQSRHNEVTAAQLEAAGYDVLLAGTGGGVHLAVDRGRGRRLLMQGHPEYDAISLLKEYKREVLAYGRGDRADYPPLPQDYLSPAASTIVAEYGRQCQAGCGAERTFPEAAVAKHLGNPWLAPACVTVANWLRSLGLSVVR